MCFSGTGNILQDPIAPTNSACQHYVCKACKGKKMMMKPSCSWCKDYEQFEENKQLCILVDCYRRLCEYVAASPLADEGSADFLALLKEGLSLEAKPDEDSLLPSLDRHSPAPSTSDDQPPGTPEVKEQPLSPLGVNGLQDCNGLSSVDELTASLPSPNATVPVEVEPGVVKQENFTNDIPVSEAVAAAGDELCASGMDICGYEDIKHDGGTLLLSVEEVLRTLEPDPVSHECPSILQANLNGPPFSCPTPSPDSSPQLSSLPSLNASGVPASQVVLLRPPPCSAVTPRPPRCHRKRSRSESDSEKILPLPISTLIRGPALGAAAPVPVKCEAKALPHHTAAVPNGGGISKSIKAVMVPSKTVKKTLEQHAPKKAYSKSKQGAPKSKDKPKDRMVGNSLVPGSPTKVVYKKPQEKKGCKCGRATQNPSVLTCRGQRCPCYSNRKACLDCICRGCQNSYMANGEKKLEAFAVPEKALEQTRLTLGINVTSIAMRNATASGTPGVLSVPNPTPSFLTATAHEDKSFDDTLDMRFDC